MDGTPAEALAAQPEHGGAIALLDHDGDLAEAIPDADHALARRTLVAPAFRLGPGPLDVEELHLPDSTFALLVIEGELTSDVRLDGRSLTEILVPGDLETPWAPDVEGLPVTRELVVGGTARLAVLESRFLLACARWPSLMLVVQRRLAAQKQRLAVHGAICQFPRVEDRLLAMLRHIADRTGRVTAEGTIIPVRLTHEALGKLVGARRPTVSLAMKELAADGRVRRQPDGTWLLLDETLPGSG
jgi:CRP/FNR family cyclic AMP-dependent transcriptional regulator